MEDEPIENLIRRLARVRMFPGTRMKAFVRDMESRRLTAARLEFEGKGDGKVTLTEKQIEYIHKLAHQFSRQLEKIR